MMVNKLVGCPISVPQMAPEFTRSEWQNRGALFCGGQSHGLTEYPNWVLHCCEVILLLKGVCVRVFPRVLRESIVGRLPSVVKVLCRLANYMATICWSVHAITLSGAILTPSATVPKVVHTFHSRSMIHSEDTFINMVPSVLTRATSVLSSRFSTKLSCLKHLL